jgi:transforming growth factor-beta-induced protein
LKYHVLGSRIFSSDIPNALGGNSSAELTSVAEASFTLNSDLTISDSDAALSLGTENASIVDTDIFATNGVIHVSDEVIIP